MTEDDKGDLNLSTSMDVDEEGLGTESRDVQLFILSVLKADAQPPDEYMARKEAGIRKYLETDWFMKLEFKGQLELLGLYLDGDDNVDIESAAFEDACKNLLTPIIDPPAPERMVAVDYHIKDSDLTHLHDVNEFARKIKDVADTWKSKDGDRYIAPYFPFIQSSGMGKTKIMYEYHKLNKESTKFILSRSIKLENEDDTAKLYDHVLNFPDITRLTNRQLPEAAENICKYLDDVLLPKKKKPANRTETKVLLFDEAQFLLDKQLEEEAFLFRCIRIWLREKRDGLILVAVFAGTTASLSNYNLVSDKNLEPRKASRDWVPIREYYDKGSLVFEPFLFTTTVGSGLVGKEDNKNLNFYESSIMYGRPLFAKMQENNQLEKHIPTILYRTLLISKTSDDWMDQANSWLSILGTRVQMGQTTVAITSELVARGYAVLTHVTESSASFSFLPDPVCARLAMCLMDDKWELSRVKGQAKTWWVEKIVRLYSRGLCRPEKGDMGEVMVALYFLFCGDLLRAKNSKHYKTLEVQLGPWINLLITGGERCSCTAAKEDDHVKDSDGDRVKISFIQVCRNYLRCYESSWKDFSDQKFLKHMYASGTAFYLFAGCPLIDMAAAMRVEQDDGSSVYRPLLVSIKSRTSFGPNPASQVCAAMVKRAKSSGIKGALCLLVVFGSAVTSDDTTYNTTLDDTVVEKIVKGETVGKVLRIPITDVFKLSQSFLEITAGTAIPEIFASHSYIMGHSKSQDGLKSKDALRTTALTARAKGMFEALSSQFRTMFLANPKRPRPSTLH